jgi:hypothetical protein
MSTVQEVATMTSKLGWSKEDHDKENELSIVVGVCREDNPRDVDEAYGAGTYARLFPPKTYKAEADQLFPAGCQCPDDSGSCDWCAIYYDGPAS